MAGKKLENKNKTTTQQRRAGRARHAQILVYTYSDRNFWHTRITKPHNMNCNYLLLSKLVSKYDLYTNAHPYQFVDTIFFNFPSKQTAVSNS